MSKIIYDYRDQNNDYVWSGGPWVGWKWGKASGLLGGGTMAVYVCKSSSSLCKGLTHFPKFKL